MNRAELIVLLESLRDEGATPATVVAARDALAHTEIGASLPLAELFTDDAPGDAVAVLGMLQDPPGSLLAEALTAELNADDGGLVDGVMATLFGAPAIPDPVRETVPVAVHVEAGVPPELGVEHDADAVDVAPAIEDEAGRIADLAAAHDGAAVALAPAVEASAGRLPDLAAAHDASAVPVAPAVTTEAGRSPDVAAVHDDAALPVGPALVGEAGRAPDVALAHDAGALPIAVALGAEAGEAPDVAMAHDPWAVAVAAALTREAGAAPELGSLHDAAALPIGDALRLEAGEAPDVASTMSEGVDVVSAVLAEAGRAPELAAAFDEAAVDLGASIAAEAGSVELTGAIFEALGLETVELAAALQDEAGEVDLTDAVFASLGLADEEGAEVVSLAAVRETVPDGAWISQLLDREFSDADHRLAAARLTSDAAARAEMTAFADIGRELREGLSLEAGDAPALWHAVAAGIGVEDPERVEGWDESLLAAAVEVERGVQPDVAAAVMETISRDAHTIAPTELPEPANTNRGWVAVVGIAAAALLLFSLIPQFGGIGGNESEWTERPMELAGLGEVNVDTITIGDEASVFVQVPENTETPLIIYVDDGTAH